MAYRFALDLQSHLAAVTGAEPPPIEVELCPPGMDGDVTVNGFRLAKSLRRSPQELATLVARFLESHPDVAAVRQVKAFVNVSLKPASLFRDTVGSAEALLGSVGLPQAERRRILVEYSAPNTNKPQHLGHVRNNSLGLAMVSILRRVGHTVFPVNLINDRGIHICKSMVAYQRWGEGRTPGTTGLKGDHLVGDYYVRFDQEFRRQLKEWRQAHPQAEQTPDEELFLETEIGRAAQDLLVAWEQGDPAVRTLWERLNGWVIRGFDETYATMGVTFARTYLESQTYLLGRDLIADGLARGVFYRSEDGAVLIDLTAEKLGTKAVLRRDGTSVYITQDIGTTVLKHTDFAADTMVWVVGDEQIFHFQVLFAILRRLGYPWAHRLYHMAYGMVNLPSGRMKSREGTVVDADDLFAEMTRLAREATIERSGPDLPADLEERARVIGMGALKFMLLKVNPKTTILFDPEASVKFEGDTGPYVLYAYARICSLLRKAGPEAVQGPVDWSRLGQPEEKELALRCAAYGPTLRRAAAELDTSCLAAYLLDLAKAFSRFYRECPVLAAPEAELRRARLDLSSRVRDVLGDGLQALTIGTIEAM
jgi:arginyl-tRNA synthetase